MLTRFANSIDTFIKNLRERRRTLHQRESELNRVANPLDLLTDMSEGDALKILLRATSYAQFYWGRFLTKYLMCAGALATPILFLPWPIKIVIDHVVLKAPIATADDFSLAHATIAELLSKEKILWKS